MNTKVGFSRRQWRIFIGCSLAYFSAYLARLNLSAALSPLMADMQLTGAQGGLLQTVFAAVYAAGQFVNGAIVDRVSARWYILLGLLLTGLFNLLSGLATAYWMLVLLWALNGAAQSMLWTPLVKLMAIWFKGHRRSRVSFGMTVMLIAANLCAWSLAGLLATRVSWRWSFIVPAIWVVLSGAGSWLILRDRPEPGEDLGEEEIPEPSAESVKKPVRSILWTTGLVQILICCVGNGFVRDGILTWAPTIIAGFGSAGTLDPTVTSLIVPLLNLFGVLLARKAYSVFGENPRRTTGALMLLSSLLSFFLIPAGVSVYACALLLGLSCSLTYGVNPLLTTIIPMEYEDSGRVGLVAGMVDAFIYAGSALAGVMTGAVSDTWGWQPVFLLWGAAGAAAGAAVLMSVRSARRLEGGKA